MSDPSPTAKTAQTPTLRVISASATPEEVAAIVAVLAAVGGSSTTPESPASRWTGRSRTGWKGSSLPRR
ncbi:acyl-CoA carboxylase epsilon subunit [Dermatophilaceae bacterium Sec6.4]